MLRLTGLIAGCALACTAAAENCQIPYGELLKQNAVNIGHLSLGMTKAQVTALMTDCTTLVHNNPYLNPLRSDMLQKDADSYEVLYYLTRVHPAFQPIRDSQAMPVVLKNGAVVGWGYAALQQIP